MDNEFILDAEEAISSKSDRAIMEGFAWWERKRILFNIALAVPGLLAAFKLSTSFEFPGEFVALVVVALIYAVCANLFFFLGFLFEMLDRHYLNETLSLHKYRMALFLLGTIPSVGLTSLFTWLSWMVE